MSDYLTREELRELTDAKSRKKQERWLRENGFAFLVSTTGQIKVLRAHRDAKLGMIATIANHAQEPDFSMFPRRG